MENVQLAYPNRVRLGTITGPGFVPSRPVSYLSDSKLSKRARSCRTRGRFFIAFPSAIVAGIIALGGCNFTDTATFRVKGYSSDPRQAYEKLTEPDCLFLNFEEDGLTLPVGYALTTTRSGTAATYFDATGTLVTSTTANTPRVSYDPTTGQCIGLLAEGAATNALTRSRDFSNAAWTKSNITAALTATGLDGVANSASRLTATAANGVVDRTYAGSSNTFSVYIKRVSGSGSIQLTTNNGTAWTTITGLSSSVWTRYTINANTNGSDLGIRIVTSGDVIDVDCAQLETGNTGASSPIVTTTTSVTRNDESHVITVPSTYRPDGNAGTWVTKLRMLRGSHTAPSTHPLRLYESANDQVALGAVASQRDFEPYITVGGSSANLLSSGSFGENVDGLAVLTWSDGDNLRYSQNGNGPDASGGAVDTAEVGAIRYSEIRMAPSDGLSMGIEKIVVWRTAEASASLVTLSALLASVAAAYDSGDVDAWPAAWVSGATDDEKLGARDAPRHIPATPQTYAYWSIDVVDDDNPLGVVEVGRPFIGDAWSPVTNMNWGASIGYEPRAEVTEAFGGAEYFVEASSPRVARFTLGWLSEAEAMRNVLEIQRQLGVSRELLLSLVSDDDLYRPMRSFFGRLRSVSPPALTFNDIWSVNFEIKELL